MIHTNKRKTTYESDILINPACGSGISITIASRNLDYVVEPWSKPMGEDQVYMEVSTFHTPDGLDFPVYQTISELLLNENEVRPEIDRLIETANEKSPEEGRIRITSWTNDEMARVDKGLWKKLRGAQFTIEDASGQSHNFGYLIRYRN